MTQQCVQRVRTSCNVASRLLQEGLPAWTVEQGDDLVTDVATTLRRQYAQEFEQVLSAGRDLVHGAQTAMTWWLWLVRSSTCLHGCKTLQSTAATGYPATLR